MATISGTVTADGVTATLRADNTREDVYFAITGPFDGDAYIEKALSPAELAWERVFGPFDGSVSVAKNVRAAPQDRFRLRFANVPTDLVTNGAFAADTDWTKGTGWTIAGGVADAAGAISTDLEQTVALVAGASYTVTFTATRSAGSVTVKIGGTSGTARSSSATFSEVIVAGSSNSLIEFSGSGFTGTIDDVSIVPIITYSFNDTDAILEEVKDLDGNVQLTRRQSGYTFEQAIVAAAGVTGEVNGVSVTDIQAIDPAVTCSYFTDFLGDALEDELLAGVGSGTGNAVALVTGQGGRVQIKSASNDGLDAANISSLGLGSLSYRADAGGLVLEARIQLDAITDVAIFIGFTDALPSTIEMPVFLVAGDIAGTAADACGVLFDTDGTTAQWCHGGMENGTDTTPAFSGTAPTAATWHKVRVEVSADGAVQGFIDDVAIGEAVDSAVTITAPLCPILVVNNRGAAARNLLVDYLKVQQNR